MNELGIQMQVKLGHPATEMETAMRMCFDAVEQKSVRTDRSYGLRSIETRHCRCAQFRGQIGSPHLRIIVKMDDIGARKPDDSSGEGIPTGDPARVYPPASSVPEVMPVGP